MYLYICHYRVEQKRSYISILVIALGFYLSVMASILSKASEELANITIQVDIINSRSRECVFPALCFLWGLSQLLEKCQLWKSQYKSKMHCLRLSLKHEPCSKTKQNKKLLPWSPLCIWHTFYGLYWLDIDIKFEWEMMSRTPLVSNKWAFEKCQYVINTLTKINLSDLSLPTNFHFQNSQEFNN